MGKRESAFYKYPRKPQSKFLNRGMWWFPHVPQEIQTTIAPAAPVPRGLECGSEEGNQHFRGPSPEPAPHEALSVPSMGSHSHLSDGILTPKCQLGSWHFTRRSGLSSFPQLKGSRVELNPVLPAVTHVEVLLSRPFLPGGSSVQRRQLHGKGCLGQKTVVPHNREPPTSGMTGKGSSQCLTLAHEACGEVPSLLGEETGNVLKHLACETSVLKEIPASGRP